MPSDILIVPSRGSTTVAPIIQFSGSAGNTIRLEVLPSGSISFLGASGSLFSITDNLQGSLMAVSDISGLPIFEVLSDDRVVMGKYNTNALVVTGSKVGIGKSVPNISVALDVSGSAIVTGSLSVSREFSSNALWTNASSISYWGGFPTAYGVLTWNTGYATVAANTGNNLYLSANGATSTGHITITTNGDIGINKTTANSKLDVNGNVLITGSLSTSGYIYPAADTAFYIRGTLAGNGLIRGNIVSTDVVDSFWVRDSTGTNTYFDVDVASGGRVIVGKTSANAKFDVTGSALITGSLTVSDNSGVRIVRTSNTDQTLTLTGGDGAGMATVRAAYQLNLDSNSSIYPMTFQIGGSEKIRITSGGDFAINKTTANAKLDVNGDAIVTGSLAVTGSASIIGNTRVSGSFRVTGSASIIGDTIVTGSLSVNNMVTSTGLTLLQPGFAASRIISAPGDITFYSASTSNPILEIDSVPSSLATRISTGTGGGASNTRLILAAESSFYATSTFTLPNSVDIAFGEGTASLNVPLGITSNKESFFNGSLRVGRFAGGVTGAARILVGSERTANGDAYIYLVGDTTYTSYGLGFNRGSTGANATSFIDHRGTGDFTIGSTEAANLIFKTSNTTKMLIAPGGTVAIGKTTPNTSYILDVNGNTVITGSLTVTGDVTSNNTSNVLHPFLLMGA